VEAVWAAIRQRFGAIAEETQNSAPQTRKNRWNRERERWQLAFLNAKTEDDFRHALTGLFARGGSQPSMHDRLPTILPLLRGEAWRRSRDLALLALWSYRGRGLEAGAEDMDEEPQPA